MKDSPYKLAYEREKKARKLAEKLLDEKTRELYQHCTELETANEYLSSIKKKLIQADKMSSLGQLAAGVAHEINNPLSYALCNLDFLSNYFHSYKKLDEFVVNSLKKHNKLELTDLSKIRQHYEIDYINQDGEELIKPTIDGLKKIQKITESLKQVSHQNSVKTEQCNINECIKNSLKVVWNELKYSMEVQTYLAEVPLISFDNGEIHQVLMNIFLNAKHACDPKGQLKISSCLEDMDNQTWVKVEISDNGTGIPPEVIERIFEPFYTTKPVGEGTGLGLSISLSIIENNGGKLKVTTQLGRGTTFTLYLKKSCHDELKNDSASLS
ncbi:sensor histidine kinase [Colwelliaceae bacterium MEBiC 14330]